MVNTPLQSLLLEMDGYAPNAKGLILAFPWAHSTSENSLFARFSRAHEASYLIFSVQKRQHLLLRRCRLISLCSKGL